MKKDWPHKNLVAWQEAMELVRLNYLFASKLPPDEKFNITSQIKRASVSVPLNIAEGAGRKSDKEFRHFLHIAHGSLSEVNTVLDLCVLLNFCSKETIESLNKQAQLSVFEYIETWHNIHRRHSALNYMTPIEYQTFLQTRNIAA